MSAGAFSSGRALRHSPPCDHKMKLSGPNCDTTFTSMIRISMAASLSVLKSMYQFAFSVARAAHQMHGGLSLCGVLAA